MAPFNPSPYVGKIIGSHNPEAVDEGFADLKSLQPPERARVVNLVEEFFVDTFHAYAPTVRAEVIEVRKLLKELEDSGMMDQVNEGLNSSPLVKTIIEPFQTQAQMAWHIREAKGDKADPLVRGMVDKVGVLSSDDYNSVQGAVKVLLEMIEEFGGPANDGPNFNPPPRHFPPTPPRGPKF